MRGKVAGAAVVSRNNRITPAYAGKREFLKNGRETLVDHPRLCGEKVLYGFFDVSAQGSPPPMRGKEKPETGEGESFGITPAYAGKSFSGVGSSDV